MTSSAPKIDQCPAICAGANERCQLDAGHNSRHSSSDGALTWEPLYVAELRDAVEDAKRDPWRTYLEDVLRDVGEGLTSEAIVEARGALEDAQRREEALR